MLNLSDSKGLIRRACERVLNVVIHFCFLFCNRLGWVASIGAWFNKRGNEKEKKCNRAERHRRNKKFSPHIFFFFCKKIILNKPNGERCISMPRASSKQAKESDILTFLSVTCTTLPACHRTREKERSTTKQREFCPEDGTRSYTKPCDRFFLFLQKNHPQ